ncbi:MAG TPA: hypothetical protein VF941_15515, partial [Clostridia bacterium]
MKLLIPISRIEYTAVQDGLLRAIELVELHNDPKNLTQKQAQLYKRLRNHVNDRWFSEKDYTMLCKQINRASFNLIEKNLIVKTDEDGNKVPNIEMAQYYAQKYEETGNVIFKYANEQLRKAIIEEINKLS